MNFNTFEKLYKAYDEVIGPILLKYFPAKTI